MAPKKKKAAGGFRYPSLTSEGETFDPACFASEILCVRSAAMSKDTLPAFFWRKATECPEQYKKLFSDGIECFRKLGRTIPPHFLIQCCIYSRLNTINYGYVTATVQKRWETWKTNSVNRINGHVKNQANKLSIAEDIIKNAQNTELGVDEIDREEIITRSADIIARKRKVRF